MKKNVLLAILLACLITAFILLQGCSMGQSSTNAAVEPKVYTSEKGKYVIVVPGQTSIAEGQKGTAFFYQDTKKTYKLTIRTLNGIVTPEVKKEVLAEYSKLPDIKLHKTATETDEKGREKYTILLSFTKDGQQVKLWQVLISDSAKKRTHVLTFVAPLPQFDSLQEEFEKIEKSFTIL